MIDVLMFALWLAITAAAVYAIAAHRRRMAARAAVTADCLVCTYAETKADVRAAAAAGNMHGDKTGHPLILVFAQAMPRMKAEQIRRQIRRG